MLERGSTAVGLGLRSFEFTDGILLPPINPCPVRLDPAKIAELTALGKSFGK
jgi:hypothetical protein